jgi:Uma2 family endonuclease
LGTVYGDGVQLSNKTANLSTSPDAMFVLRHSLRTGRLKRVPRKDRKDQYIELEGTPDLVVEVISQSSWKKDTKVLFELYHRAGVPEYWLVDAFGEDIDFKILQRGRQTYTAIESQRGWLKSAVLKRDVKLIRSRDEDGDWEYGLKVRTPK